MPVTCVGEDTFEAACESRYIHSISVCKDGKLCLSLFTFTLLSLISMIGFPFGKLKHLLHFLDHLLHSTDLRKVIPVMSGRSK